MTTVRIASDEDHGDYRILAPAEPVPIPGEVYEVEVEDAVLTRWRDAQYHYALAQTEMGTAFSNAEDAYYESLPPPDPDAPPPGPIRDLFPMAVTRPAHEVRFHEPGGPTL